MPFALHPPGPRCYYPFRFFDDVTKKWTSARYVAELHVIAERYAQWEITGPPEIQTRGGEHDGSIRGPSYPRNQQLNCVRTRNLRPTRRGVSRPRSHTKVGAQSVARRVPRCVSAELGGQGSESVSHRKAAVGDPRHALTATTSMASRPKRTYARRRHHAIEHHESSTSAFTRAHNDEDSQFPERMCVGLEGRRGSRRRGLRIVGRRQRSKPSLFSTGCQRLRLCCGDCQVNVPLLYDFDGLLPGDLGHLLPRIAIATQGAASA